VAGDFDKDGDQDLFVGGRVVPGRFPEAPSSILLRNDSSATEVSFTDVTGDLAHELANAGMVTAAVWRDVDGDGWDDLVCATDWGPVRLYLNKNGRLVERTEAFGLAERLGWWNGIAGDDFDGDGDADFIVTNYGLNTKYDATIAAPAFLYFGDLDGSGVRRLVEAKADESGRHVPLRGRTVWSNSIPSVSDGFTTHDAFAQASVLDLFGARLADAMRFEVNEVRSGVLINQQTDGFEFQPLPTLAQISPGFDVALFDADHDGNVDAFITQNFYGSHREIGRLAGGCGALLLGNGRGQFDEVWPNESGISVPQAAASAAVVDFNGDRRPDLIIAINDGRARAFESAANLPAADK
jgi:hypothetical protein